MARAEPAMVDVHGAVWTGRHDYKLVPSAKRYELYEMSYVAKASYLTCEKETPRSCTEFTSCDSTQYTCHGG